MTADVSAAPVAGAEIKRNAVVLAVASMVMGAQGAMAFSLGGLAGLYLLGTDKSLATLPLTAYTIGVALGAIPAAAIMRRMGRRFGFRTGALAAIAGGCIAGWGVMAGSFLFLLLGLGVVGVAGSFTQQYRFAAGDDADPVLRARAMSWVLGGGVAAGVIGPQTVILTRDLLLPIPFAGGFFAMAGLGAVGLLILSFLSGAAARPPRVSSASGGRPLGEIVRQPRFIVAVICAMGSYALMSLVMTAAPLAIVACGLGEDNAALGIQWHVLAMFGPSFVTGALINRFGKERVVAAGFVLLAAAAGVALLGIDLLHFWLALILLGLGWNFGFIGATAMVAETYRPEERAKVEGLNDFLVFGFVAFASASSGKLFSSVGWDVLLLVTYPLIAVCLIALSTRLFAGRVRAA